MDKSRFTLDISVVSLCSWTIILRALELRLWLLTNTIHGIIIISFCRVVKDGVETVTVLENGVMTSNKVNGVEKMESITDGSSQKHRSRKS